MNINWSYLNKDGIFWVAGVIAVVCVLAAAVLAG